jgi:hypothetical protein
MSLCHTSEFHTQLRLPVPNKTHRASESDPPGNRAIEFTVYHVRKDEGSIESNIRHPGQLVILCGFEPP